MLDGAILGFDVGTKRIGVAVGQTITASARPLQTLTRSKDGQPPWDIIDALMKQWRVQALVIGIPLNMDGTEQKITRVCRRFARECRERYSCPIGGVDERLSTVEAKQRVFDQEGYRGLKQADIDSMAAALMIEQWLLSGQQADEEF